MNVLIEALKDAPYEAVHEFHSVLIAAQRSYIVAPHVFERRPGTSVCIHCERGQDTIAHGYSGPLSELDPSL